MISVSQYITGTQNHGYPWLHKEVWFTEYSKAKEPSDEEEKQYSMIWKANCI